MGNILAAYVCPHAPVLIPEISGGRQPEITSSQEALWNIAEEIKSLNPDTIIVTTPHGVSFRDAISITTIDNIEGNFKNFGKKHIQMRFENNSDIVTNIINQAKTHKFPLVELNEKLATACGCDPVLDHGAMVPLYFIQKKLPKFKIVHISMGFLEYENLLKFSGFIKKAVDESKSDCVIVASGDLSHRLKESGPYGYHPAGKIFDDKIIEIIKSGKLQNLSSIEENLASDAAQCGLSSFITMAGCFSDVNIKSSVLSYEGPFGVGYCVAKINKINSVAPKDKTK